jgi:D-alanyl-D-alanine carboxypeptidase
MPTRGRIAEVVSFTRRGVGFGLAFAVMLVAAPEPAAADDLKTRVDACMVSAMGEDTPGAALALVRDGELAYERGYGVKRRGQDEPVNAGTLFRTGSIQKMMTAAAVLAQADRGRLRPGEPITRLVPELRFAPPSRAGQVRLHHLLTHTAGVPNLDELNCGGDDDTLSQWAQSLGRVHLYAFPGAFWNYSNAGYDLVGLAAERAAGRPYPEVMRQTIWEPAGMHSTFARPPEAIAYGDFSYGHFLNPTTGEAEVFAPDAYECRWASPSGEAFTTAGDLARWAQVLMKQGAGVLSPASARALQAPWVPTQVPLHGPSSYGYGVMVTPMNGVRVLHHDGSVPGWTSSLVWVPDRRFAVSVVGNASSGAPGAATRCVLREALGIEWPAPVLETTPPATWVRYTGTYLVRHEGGQLVPARVRLRGRNLSVLTTDPETREPLDLPAYQVHRETFFVDIDGNGQLNLDAELITFIETRHRGQPTRWLRSNAFVGRRVRGPK